jgi:hypothetical protein
MMLDALKEQKDENPKGKVNTRKVLRPERR